MKISDPSGKKPNSIKIHNQQQSNFNKQSVDSKALKEDSGRISNSLKNIEELVSELETMRAEASNKQLDKSRLEQLKGKNPNSYDTKAVAKSIVEKLF